MAKAPWMLEGVTVLKGFRDDDDEPGTLLGFVDDPRDIHRTLAVVKLDGDSPSRTLRLVDPARVVWVAADDKVHCAWEWMR